MYVCTYECMYKTAYKSPVGFLFQLLAIWLVLYIPSKPPPKMCLGVVVHNFSVQLQAGGVYPWMDVILCCIWVLIWNSDDQVFCECTHTCSNDPV